MTKRLQLLQKAIKKTAGMYNIQLIAAVFLLIITLMQISSEINCDIVKLIERAQDHV